ncbi:hypothetical protein MPER_06744 [Moniliophthora perniciosa FA553]|nr:hypothetical protein MPER_06744 [Moniliophthora perniciosa FA553]
MKQEINLGINPEGPDDLSEEDKRRVIKAIDTGAIADEDKEKPGGERTPDTPGDDQIEIVGGIENVIAMNKRSRGDRETHYASALEEKTHNADVYRDDSVLSATEAQDGDDVDPEMNGFELPNADKHVEQPRLQVDERQLAADKVSGCLASKLIDAATYRSPPKLALEDFCEKYALSQELQNKLKTLQIEGPHVLRFVSDDMFLGQNLTIGELAGLRDAQERWTEDCV